MVLPRGFGRLPRRSLALPPRAERHQLIMASKDRSIVVTPLQLHFRDGSRVRALAIDPLPAREVVLDDTDAHSAVLAEVTLSLSDVVTWADSWSETLH